MPLRTYLDSSLVLPLHLFLSLERGKVICSQVTQHRYILDVCSDKFSYGYDHCSILALYVQGYKFVFPLRLWGLFSVGYSYFSDSIFLGRSSTFTPQTPLFWCMSSLLHGLDVSASGWWESSQGWGISCDCSRFSDRSGSWDRLSFFCWMFVVSSSPTRRQAPIFPGPSLRISHRPHSLSLAGSTVSFYLTFQRFLADVTSSEQIFGVGFTT